ncbi:MAG: hypothetical protein UT65_C0028G0008 [Parcubacteria group bacterium GW2011_GWF2_39_8b]|uniref:PEGA domain-containing protein n=3 Tax=Candidatus Zambryskiibacteriota TaxID=1817925 RepID=A0A1G2TA10_9BACT|nr:MAG: hypothetical protein UT65_C0028G0008 [Parcubacteria group bacterium GW2011_GWF2_39_8b]KKR45184.1 MAG: hypothetical protein UT81_C0019G0004 [Parcubacteria group bacterium GW2011_GWA2_40_14]OHA93992.1 MAG: hypothetical protein A2W58_01885 [Candidatus Zambryskibacteria bacterium RIFCSPHIGHO2_02_38_10.5]OHA95364.1 MAG: hypothetical protein A3C63_01150 [Candidatus Zambryskibacteria bacterium RIFCSPHIGHO2_02_FULL_39_82]OHA98543.1 MAG: hypothetical protein A3E32_03180 [Candidatus Zambryskibact
MVHLEKRTRLWIWVGTGILIILVFIIGYNRDYRFRNNFTIGKVGTLTVTLPLPDTFVYVDETEKAKTTKENETVVIKLSPRTHSVITSHIGYYPWTKQITIPSDENIILSPIFVSVNASGMIITNNDSDYWKIRDMVERYKLPTKESPITSDDKTTIIWLYDNAIMATVGSTTTTVIQPDTIIRNIAFYKDRSDAVIFSTYTAIYVIEIAKGDSQNFFPIYKGTSPSFIKVDPNFIYVKDGANLMQVVI